MVLSTSHGELPWTLPRASPLERWPSRALSPHPPTLTLGILTEAVSICCHDSS